MGCWGRVSAKEQKPRYSLGQTFWFEGFAWGCVGSGVSVLWPGNSHSCFFRGSLTYGHWVGTCFCGKTSCQTRCLRVVVGNVVEHAVVLGYSVPRVQVYNFFEIQTLQMMFTFQLQGIIFLRKADDIRRRLCWFLPLKLKPSFAASFVAFRWVEKTSDVFYGFVSGMDVLGIRQFIFALEIQLALMLSSLDRQVHCWEGLTCFLLYTSWQIWEVFRWFHLSNLSHSKTWDILRWFLPVNFLSSTHPVRKHEMISTFLVHPYWEGLICIIYIYIHNIYI